MRVPVKADRHSSRGAIWRVFSTPASSETSPMLQHWHRLLPPWREKSLAIRLPAPNADSA
ncbi:hypothetical protein HMPREF9946_04505 [Acetobacteraceae bacterium AT-5844]|nr:hypothetical protein HMPREF9946_04505 [Acetobacteraceae bacterium AT-5844]